MDTGSKIRQPVPPVLSHIAPAPAVLLQAALLQATRLLLRAAALWMICTAPLHAQTSLHIANAAALDQALDDGTLTGATALLEPGTYGPLTLRPGQAPAVLRSADPETPAQILGILADGFDGLLIENVVLRYAYTPGDALNFRPFSFVRGRGLTLRGVTVQGDLLRGTGGPGDGHGTGIGIGIQQSRDIVITDSTITTFHRAAAFSETRNITLTGNEVTNIRMDGLVFAQVEDVEIADNHIHTFDRVFIPEDHADMIQFWTTATTAPSRNITIRGNVMNSGAGGFTQTIFMRNELVDTGRAGEEMFYRNILIEENVIINAQLHGITVGETDGLIIRHNTLAQNPLSAGGPPQDRVWHPSIRISEGSRRVRVIGNISADPRGYTGPGGWTVRDNLIIQNRSLIEPYHYNTIFSGWPQGDPRRVETYRYQTPLTGVGATRLQP